MSSKGEWFPLRVVKGAFEPADEATRKRLRGRYHLGDVVMGMFRKPRNPKFMRLAHALGGLCRENIPDFTYLTAHQVLKKLQIEGNIACDELPIRFELMGQSLEVKQRNPQSLSFENMDEGEFREVFQAMCRLIAERYWPGMSPEQVEEMALMFPTHD